MSDMSTYSNETIKNLNKRLLASEDLVRQHTRVAEEAISGWEKDKSEYESMKIELEAAREQQQAMEDMVSHLDGALKACMCELRNLREEQEERIHEAIIKKTRACEDKSLELEANLRNVNGDLTATRYENVRLLELVREQSDTILELEKTRCQLKESQAQLLVRVEAFEKETVSLKYEIRMVNKELAIRNQEREINQRSSDASRRLHLDDAKKMANLETENLKLKKMVRRKLPGPAITSAHLKQDINCLDATGKREMIDRRWRSGTHISQGSGSSKSVHSESSFKSRRFLSDHGLVVEEEVVNKTFEEASAKKLKGLQEVKFDNGGPTYQRAMLERCSQASPRGGSSLISHASDSPLSLGSGHKVNHFSVSDDGNDDNRSIADSWASMLVTELEKFQKEKPALEQPDQTKDLVLWSVSVDDFMEMERIAALSLGQEGPSDNGKQKLTSPISQMTNPIFCGKECIEPNFCTGEKSSKTSPELMSAVYKLSQLVEEMGSKVISQHITLGSSIKDGSPHTIGDNSHIELGLNVKNFTSIADQFLHGQLELLHFIAELSSALGQINNINVRGATIVRQVEELPFSPGSKDYIAGQGPKGLLLELSPMPGIVEPDVLSDAEGPFSTNARNVDSSEHHGDMKSFVVSDGKMETLKEHRNNDDEVRKLRAEKTALQSHMRAEFSRIAAVEHNLVELKQEKSKLEDMLGQEKEKLVVVQRQLSDAEQLIENLQENLRLVKVSRDLAQERLTSAEGINAMLESLLKESQLQSIHTAGKMESLQSEAIQMNNTIKTLEQSIEEEKARSRDLTIKVETLQDSLERANSSILQAEATLAAAAKKDEEHTSMNADLKLVEYNSTLVALGRQVEQMGSMKYISTDDAMKEGDEGGNSVVSSFRHVSMSRVGEDGSSEVQSPSSTPPPQDVKLPKKKKSGLIKFFTRQKRT